ncbi:hypothetical protein SynBIOSE41_00993 [Synechococcus sp. BIOS-E4-1]|nr:hypothetical protein SynBIOSE41_00993 [Synechococcus sp. BIOS-E4-1]
MRRSKLTPVFRISSKPLLIQMQFLRLQKMLALASLLMT